MAIQSVGPLLWPSFTPRANAVNPTYTSNLIDAAGEKMATILKVPTTGTITAVGFRTGTVAVNGNADVRLETVDATTGDPTGTLLAANTNGTQTLNAANTWWTTTLTAGASVTRGDSVAVVIVNTTGQYNISSPTISVWPVGYPYADHFQAAWAHLGQTMALALEYSGGVYECIPGVAPYSSLNVISFNSSSSPAIRALKFRLPLSVQVTGAWAYADFDGDCDVSLYQDDSTVFSGGTASIDKDVRSTTGASVLLQVLFPTKQTLAANTFYRLALVPTTTTSVNMYDFDVASAAVMAAAEGGADFHYSTLSGTWTDTTTKRPFIGLIVDGIDSGGGLIGGGGIRGGFQ